MRYASPAMDREGRPRLIRCGTEFFDRPARALARALLGQILVHRVAGGERRARIVETEAYLGPIDRASHAFHGRTVRTEPLFGPPGRAYVYLIYGLHEMLNVVAGAQAGVAQCVLIRGALPLDGWEADLLGPGKLTRAFEVDRRQNGIDVAGSQLFVLRDPTYRPRVAVTPRIGIDYAGAWRDAPLRFVDSRAGVGERPGGERRRRR